MAEITTYKCDRCGANIEERRCIGPIEVKQSRQLFRFRQYTERYDLCKDCWNKLNVFLKRKNDDTLYPMGDSTFAIACVICKNSGSDACMECKMEAKSGFEIDPNIRIVHEPTETKVGAENETAKSEK